MTNIRFSDSLSRANDFAVKLLSGLLNIRVSDDVESGALVEVSHTTPYFTTETVPEIRTMLSPFRFTRINADESRIDPDSQWSVSELRTIIVFAKAAGTCLDYPLATFQVHRDYLDGDNAEGWTPWQIKNVEIIMGNGRKLELIKEYLDDEQEPIWGTRVS